MRCEVDNAVPVAKKARRAKLAGRKNVGNSRVELAKASLRAALARSLGMVVLD